MGAEDDLAAWLRLTLLPGVGPERQRALLAAFGLPDRIFAAGRSAIASVVGAHIADRLLTPPDASRIDAALAWAAEPGNHILTLGDPEYPAALLEIADPPVLLYVKGVPARLSARTSLAIVGARSATPSGASNAEAFGRSLAGSGLTIVSGLALGIDAAAHRGALAEPDGVTVAVIGTGADRVYPAKNRPLALEIAERGVIVSEYPLGTPPLPANFPRRNRLIAGLSRGVLVVEAAVESGSLITARLATECGREVFAIPGSIHSPLARGCHRLIRDGAKLVETASDVLEELNLKPPAPRPTERAHTGRAGAPRRGAERSSAELVFENASPDEKRVLDALGHDPLDVDTLVARAGLTVDTLYAILLALELDGHLTRLPGGRFQRL